MTAAPENASKSILRSKLFWVGVLYFAEGFPLGAFYDIFPVQFRQQGVDLSDIGFMSLLSITWSIKFLWAPAIDHYRHHRRWMFSANIIMAGVMALFAIYAEFGPWVWVAIGIFTALSATNDIAIDGYTIEFLDRREYGLANGFRIGFYRAGMLGAGFILIASDYIGWSGAYILAAMMLVAIAFACLAAPKEMPRTGAADTTLASELKTALSHPAVFAPALLLFAGLFFGATTGKIFDRQTHQYLAVGLILGSLLIAYFARNLSKDKTIGEAIKGPMFGTFLAMIQRPYFLPVVLFILIFKLADTSIGFMIKPFWVDAGFSAKEIGLVSVNIGLVLSIAGGLAGGWFTDKVGIFHGLWILGLTQAVSNLGYVWAATVIPYGDQAVPILLEHRVLLYSASAVESLTQGLGTGAFLAFLMAIVNKNRAATEYAVLSSIFALGRAVAGWAGGYGAENFGYADFFILTFVLGLPAYLLLPWVWKMLELSKTWQDQEASPPPDTS